MIPTFGALWLNVSSGLQELLCYLKTTTLSIVVGKLPAWSSFYLILSAKPFNEKAGEINDDDWGKLQSHTHELQHL